MGETFDPSLTMARVFGVMAENMTPEQRRKVAASGEETG